MSSPGISTDQSKTTVLEAKPNTSSSTARSSSEPSSSEGNYSLEAKNVSGNGVHRGRNPDSVRPSLDNGRRSFHQIEQVDIERNAQFVPVGVDGRMKSPSDSLAPVSTEAGLAARDVGWENKMGTKDAIYVDPTPKTPRQGTSPNREPTSVIEAQTDESSTSEIQSIMDQFDDGDDPGKDLDYVGSGPNDPPSASPILHPPRRSSLEPLSHTIVKNSPGSTSTTGSSATAIGPAPLNDNARMSGLEAEFPATGTPGVPPLAPFSAIDASLLSSPNQSRSMSKIPPPAPDPEPDLPFDFHRFLEQLRHRTADPVAKFLRSFLVEFGKKQWMAHEQVKIINDFLTFITNKMAQCEIWRGISDGEFDNAKEGMEKLVMNRLYSQTFSPAIPVPSPLQGMKGKKKIMEKSPGLARKGQHQEDIERDEILGQKIRIYGWVDEEHLDIPRVGDNGRRFLLLAQQELLKIKTYRAPRDKVICVLNCCKVIFGLLRNSKGADTSADSFVPLLIYVVLHANPDHLVSNVQYILRFRNQEKLGCEAGYYLSSLMGAIQFIENLDRTSLTISDEDFENKVEKAVSVIAERHQEGRYLPPSPPAPRYMNHAHISEKSTLSQPEVIPRNSIDAEYSTPRRPNPSKINNELAMRSDVMDNNTAVSGLLRTIQRPLSSLGRIFSEDTTISSQQAQGDVPMYQASPQSPPPRLSPALLQLPRNSADERTADESVRPSTFVSPNRGRKASAEDAAARQASAEAVEAQRVQQAEHQGVVETLAGMFPDLDRDVIDDVVRVKQGRVGLAVDACLTLNS